MRLSRPEEVEPGAATDGGVELFSRVIAGTALLLSELFGGGVAR